MSGHNLFYYPYASFTNEQLSLLKVAALYFDKLVILDPVGASWTTVGADHVARDAITLLKNAGILEVVTPADVLAKYSDALAEAVRRDMADREFLELCDAQAKATGKQRWTLSLAKVPQQLQTDQAMRHLMGDFTRVLAKNSGQFREQLSVNPCEYCEYTEPEFRLCHSPHVALRETETLTGRPTGTVSTKDWRVLLQQMQNILATEGEVAMFIGQRFQQLANDARSATRDNQRTPTVRDALAAFRSALIAERQQLISQEPALHNIV